jgi:hypothetical protein
MVEEKVALSSPFIQISKQSGRWWKHPHLCV